MARGAAISGHSRITLLNFVGVTLDYVVYYAFKKKGKLIHGSGAIEEDTKKSQ